MSGCHLRHAKVRTQTAGKGYAWQPGASSERDIENEHAYSVAPVASGRPEASRAHAVDAFQVDSKWQGERPKQVVEGFLHKGFKI